MVDRPPQPADDDNTKAQERRRLVQRLAVAGPLVLGLLVVLLLACVLWIPRWLYPSLTESDLKDVKTAQNQPDAAKIQELKDARLKLQNDARTTLLQGLAAVLVLTGAGIGAIVTLRQVQATRDQIKETATASRNQLKLSEQGQVTDRYTRAVEQLGHDKAPVRLGALHSLERLAQNSPEYRQTVVDVVCAYLRMPYTPPAKPESEAEQVEETAPSVNGRDRAPHPAPVQDPGQEELQVRQTAQRLLTDHLRCPPQTSGQEAQILPPSPQETFWPGISLDLTGATLVDFAFHQVSVIQAGFDGATFQGAAGFTEATFQGAATFTEATFQNIVWFTNATFHGVHWLGGARFQKATFLGAARFDEVTFHDNARFTGATFQDDALFDGATFQGIAWFDGATFQGIAGFGGATFQGDARFGGATFQRVEFEGATFQGEVRFDKATFQGDARFDGAIFEEDIAGFGGATFESVARFDKAIFQGVAGFAGATFQRFAGFAGATFQGDVEFDKATFEDTAGFKEATFQRDAGFDEATFQGAVSFWAAQVLHLDDTVGFQVWPDGWTVRPDPTDPTRGTLVHTEQTQTEEPEPAVPPADETGR